MNNEENTYKISEKIAKKGITKNPRLDDIIFPRETENKIVVFCNPSGYGFIKKENDKMYFGDLLSGSDINKTITKFNKIIDVQLGKKRVTEAKDSNSQNIFVLNILFVLGLIISIVMYIMALYEVNEFKEKYIVIPLILLLLIIIMGMVVMMRGLMKSRDMFDLDKEIYRLLLQEIDIEQNQTYNHKQVFLSLPDDSIPNNFAYLTLQKFRS